MKQFLRTVALFLVPVLLVCGLFGYIVLTSGESLTEEEIAAKVLSGEELLWGLGYRDNTRYLKHLVASEAEANLLVLGTSRSMQFRSEFFATDSFYNAGGGANYTHEYLFFLENLPKEALPDTLLVVFDQYFFQEGWSNPENLPELDYAHRDFNFYSAWNALLKNFGIGKVDLLQSVLPHPGVYGLSALNRGSGFYSDGSYYYGNLIEHPEKGSDVGFHDSFDRIAKGENRFEYADEVSPRCLAIVDEMLAFCAQNEIAVVAVIPPYAPSVYARMMETGQYGYIEQLPQALGETCAAYGFECFDFTNMPNTTDAEYFDGYHGSSRVYARIALELSESSQLLAGAFDVEYLNAALQDSGNPLQLAAVD